MDLDKEILLAGTAFFLGRKITADISRMEKTVKAIGQIIVENRKLEKTLRMMVRAMRQYEMCVDEEPPYRHRSLMEQAEKLLTPPAERGEEE